MSVIYVMAYMIEHSQWGLHWGLREFSNQRNIKNQLSAFEARNMKERI